MASFAGMILGSSDPKDGIDASEGLVEELTPKVLPTPNWNAVGPTSSPERAVLFSDRQAGPGAPLSNAVGPTSSPERAVLFSDRQAGLGAPAHDVHARLEMFLSGVSVRHPKNR
jgi:hypothetical protein